MNTNEKAYTAAEAMSGEKFKVNIALSFVDMKPELIACSCREAELYAVTKSKTAYASKRRAIICSRLTCAIAKGDDPFDTSEKIFKTTTKIEAITTPLTAKSVGPCQFKEASLALIAGSNIEPTIKQSTAIQLIQNTIKTILIPAFMYLHTLFVLTSISFVFTSSSSILLPPHTAAEHQHRYLFNKTIGL